jgi:hypothetical protein
LFVVAPDKTKTVKPTMKERARTTLRTWTNESFFNKRPLLRHDAAGSSMISALNRRERGAGEA